MLYLHVDALYHKACQHKEKYILLVTGTRWYHHPAHFNIFGSYLATHML